MPTVCRWAVPGDMWWFAGAPGSACCSQCVPAESAAVHSAHTHSTHTSNLLLTHHTFTAFICRNTFSSHKPSQTSSVKSAWTPQTCASFQLLQVPVWIVNNQQQIHTNSAHHHHHHHLPLTTRVVGAPQMILQPVSSIFPLFSTALWDLANSRPVSYTHLTLPTRRTV